MTADVTREPTGGQELRDVVAWFLYRNGNPFPDHWDGFDEATREEWRGDADELLAAPILAVLIADAANWRRVTTGDPTEPEPLAMQARTLLLRVRRVWAVAEQFTDAPHDHGIGDGHAGCAACWVEDIRTALDGEPQP